MGSSMYSLCTLVLTKYVDVCDKVKDQYKLARLPSFMDATLAYLRTAIGPTGQREVLLERLPELRMPTMILWGDRG